MSVEMLHALFPVIMCLGQVLKFHTTFKVDVLVKNGAPVNKGMMCNKKKTFFQNIFQQYLETLETLTQRFRTIDFTIMVEVLDRHQSSGYTEVEF